jgi:hypothetical protein
MIRYKTTVAAVSVLVTAAMLSACGSGGTSATQTVINATTSTLAQQSANLTVSLTSDSNPPSSFSGSGGTVFTSRQQHVTAKLVGVPGIPDGSSAELILQLPQVYVHPLGAAAAAVMNTLKISQPWLQLDIRTLASIHGVDFGSIAAAQAVEPTQYLDFLRGTTSATKIGTETVGGTSTTHYKVTVDLNQAVTKVSGDPAVTLNRDIGTFQSAVIPVDVWIDAKGLVRQLTLTLTNKPASAGAAPVHDNVSVQFSSFGASVNTSAPPSSQTSDLGPILRALAGTGG